MFSWGHAAFCDHLDAWAAFKGSIWRWSLQSFAMTMRSYVIILALNMHSWRYLWSHNVRVRCSSNAPKWKVRLLALVNRMARELLHIMESQATAYWRWSTLCTLNNKKVVHWWNLWERHAAMSKVKTLLWRYRANHKPCYRLDWVFYAWLKINANPVGPKTGLWQIQIALSM